MGEGKMSSKDVTAAAKSLQSCLTLCDPRDGSLPGSPVPGVLQARTLEWVAISFSNARKWKVKVKLLSCVQLFMIPWLVAYQAPLSMGFSRQEYWSGVPLPCPSKDGISVKSGRGWFPPNATREMALSVKSDSVICVLLFVIPWTPPTRLFCPWNSPNKNTGVGCHFLFQVTLGIKRHLLHRRQIFFYCLSHEWYLRVILPQGKGLGLTFPPLSSQATGGSFQEFPALCEWTRAKLLQSCLTLRDAKDGSPPSSSVHGILQARILEWLAVPSSRVSSQLRY